MNASILEASAAPVEAPIEAPVAAPDPYEAYRAACDKVADSLGRAFPPVRYETWLSRIAGNREPWLHDLGMLEADWLDIEQGHRTDDATLTAALAYARHLPGRLLPIQPGGKTPHLNDWPNNASRDETDVRRWFRGANSIGFTPNADIIILDLDAKGGKNGFESLAALEAEFGPLPRTLTAITPTGGEHRFFRAGDLPYKSQANACGLAGVDFRCGGRSAGFVVTAPSMRADGVYRWANWDMRDEPVIAEAPKWLQDLACGLDPRKKAERIEAAKNALRDDHEGDVDPDLVEHLRDALTVLGADDYDTWVRVGHALKTMDDDAGRDLYMAWSATSDKFDEDDAGKRWDGFKPKDTGYRAVFAMAQALGWKNPGQRKKQSVTDAVAELNKQYAMVLVGGSARILREGMSEFGGRSVQFLTKGSFTDYLGNQFVTVESANEDEGAKRKPLAPIWLKHGNRRTHEGVTFAPDNRAPEGFYNLWRGFGVEPLDCSLYDAAMKCRRLLHHMKYNVCQGNGAHFDYLLAWCADMVQDPGVKKGVALVLRGKKGTGKSKLGDMLRALLGEHAFKASRMEHVTGKFNKHLADKLLVVAEESFFAGNKQDEGPLKDLITSSTVNLEPKGVDSVEVRSCHRIALITNNEWAVPASEEERRYFVLDVGEKRMQDQDYFAAIDEQMLDGDGLRAFLTLLLNFDLSKFNLRKVPQTGALTEQKRLSLEPHDQFIADCLSEGEIAGDAWEETSCGPLRQEVYEAYSRFAVSQRVRPLSANRFGPIFANRTCAGCVQPGGGDRRRRWALLSLEESRRAFFNVTRVRIED